jgi:hypothetical protein
MGKTRQLTANLRVCGRCEWVYKLSDNACELWDGGCPSCGFASYGARWVYGNRAYRYYYTQEPWLKQRLASIESKLRAHVSKYNEQHKIHKSKVIDISQWRLPPKSTQ